MQRRIGSWSSCAAGLLSKRAPLPFGGLRSTSLHITPLLTSARSEYASVVTRSSAKKRFKVTGPFAKRKVVWHPRKLGGKSKIVGREKGHFVKLFPLGGL